MTEIRTTVRLDGHTTQILDKAAGIWPEHATNRSELLRQIAADWDRIRKENGGRTAQLVRRLEAQEEQIALQRLEMIEMKRLLGLVCDHLGIDTEIADADR